MMDKQAILDSQFLQNFQNSMKKTIDHLKDTLSGIRSNTISPDYLKEMKFEGHGTMMSIKQVGSVSAMSANSLRIDLYDVSCKKSISLAIVHNLGIQPNEVDKNSLMITIPILTEEGKSKLIKSVKDTVENSHKSSRTVRQDVMQQIDSAFKNKVINEDERDGIKRKIETEFSKFKNLIDTEENRKIEIIKK